MNIHFSKRLSYTTGNSQTPDKVENQLIISLYFQQKGHFIRKYLSCVSLHCRLWGPNFFFFFNQKRIFSMNLKTKFPFLDRGACMATVHGVTKSQTRLKRFSKDTNVIKTNTATSYSVFPVIIINDCTKNQYLFSNLNVGSGNSG